MNEKQLNRYRVISNVIEGNLKPCDAAESLGLSERQIYRLKKGVEEEGVSLLIHKIPVGNLIMLSMMILTKYC